MMLTIASLIVASTLSQPATVVAYLSPEDVLLEQQFQYYLPPNRRRVREVTEQQVIDREQQHPNLIRNPGTNLANTSSSSSSAIVTNGQTSSDDGREPPTITLDPTTLRLLQRIQRGSIRANVFESKQTPLAPTGTAAIATVVIMLVAIIWTILRASKKRGWKES